MLSKPWKSTIEMVSDDVHPILHKSMRSYSMVDVRKILKKQRALRSAAGMPVRKIAPVVHWLLDEIIDEYFEKKSNDFVLEYIEIYKG